MQVGMLEERLTGLATDEEKLSWSASWRARRGRVAALPMVNPKGLSIYDLAGYPEHPLA
jgi:hypothetical protein